MSSMMMQSSMIPSVRTILLMFKIEALLDVIFAKESISLTSIMTIQVSQDLQNLVNCVCYFGLRFLSEDPFHVCLPSQDIDHSNAAGVNNLKIAGVLWSGRIRPQQWSLGSIRTEVL